MRKLVYRIMFILVATGSIMAVMLKLSIGFSLLVNIITLTAFSDPIPVFLFYLFPLPIAQDILLPALRFALLLLVFHRLYSIFIERKFDVPATFNDALYFCAAIGVLALLLAFPFAGISIGLVSALLLLVATVSLPLVFFITELMTVKAYFRRKQPLGNIQ